MCGLLHVPEPSVDETYQILLGLRERYEAHHKLRYTDEALDSAAKYSSQYISDRFLPDKVRPPGASPGSVASLCAASADEGAQCFPCQGRINTGQCATLLLRRLASCSRAWRSRDAQDAIACTRSYPDF